MDDFHFRNIILGPRKIRRKVWEKYWEFYKSHYPQKYADYLFQQEFGYRINWKHPRDLNEWINYLAFKTDTNDWSRLADKYVVREYIESKGLSSILMPLYGVWENAGAIDFGQLPDTFAIKTNHACGDTIIVKDKKVEDLEKIRNSLNASLAYKFGVDTAEPHYLKIKPLIMAEQLLPPPTNIDYKVWCFHGIPDSIMTISDRNIAFHSYVLNIYDLVWQKHNEWLTDGFKNEVCIPRPKRLDDMIEYARVLSQGFPQVRVDFYHTNEGVFFGEMTFTSCCGRMNYFTKEHLVEMGKRVEVGFA